MQTFVRSKLPMSKFLCVPKENSCALKLIFCAFMSRLSCVRMTLYPDFRMFKTAYVQTFVRSKGKLVRSKTDNLCVHVQTIMRLKDLISRLLCIQNWLCPNFRAFERKIRALQNWYFMRSCPDYRAFKSPQVQTFVRSKLPMSRFSCVPKENSCAPKLIFCAFMSRLSCVRMTLYPDFRMFKTAYVQTFVRSKGKLVRSKTDNLCVHVQTIMRLKDLISRLLCIQNWLCPNFRAFERKIRALQNWYFMRSCPDYRAFKSPQVQTFVRSKLPMSRFSCLPKEN